MLSLTDAFDAYEAASHKLHDLHIERSELSAAELMTRANAYVSLVASGMNITAVREGADNAAATFKAEAIKLGGEIDALHAQLRWLDHVIGHHRATG